MQKEAKARIKINNLLQDSGWRFFDDEKGKANIVLENNTKITKKAIDEFGSDFEKTQGGFIDFLLLDEKGFPLVVLEAKSEDKDPLDGKEQARRYAQSQNTNYQKDPRWADETQRGELTREQDLKFLRPYQLSAIHALQKSAKEGRDRYLFEMATGTGKTLISGAVIKLFLKSGNAKRILFLVDR